MSSPRGDFAFEIGYCKLKVIISWKRGSDTLGWAGLATISAVIIAFVNIIDNHLLSKRLPSLRTFMLPLGVIHLIYGLIVLQIFPFPSDIGMRPVLVAVASGIIRAAAVIILLYGLKKEEVSRVVPVVFTYPIFVAIIAVPLLGESLGYMQWLAIIIVVAGAVMASGSQNPFGSTVWLGKLFFLLLGSSLLFALADITSKYVLSYMSPWNVLSIVAFCISFTFLLVSLRPHVISQLAHMRRRNSTLTMLVFNEILAPTGTVLSFWALNSGPVSLVSTIISSRPIFVVIFALILSRFWPTFLKWQPGKRLLILRIVAAAMIFSGIAIIYLT